MALTFPEHSFFKMVAWNDGDPAPDVGDYNRNTPVNPCGEEFLLCHPVYDLTDCRFQVFSSDSAAASNLLGLYVGICEVDGTPLQHPEPFPSYRWGALTFYESLGSGSIGLHSGSAFADGIRETIGVKGCFRFYIFNDPRTILYISKYCFTVVADKCDTTLTDYGSNENSLGFQYLYDNGGTEAELGFTNKARLWWTFERPQLKEKRKAYRKSTGDYSVSALTLEKVYECKTEWMPADMHTKLKVALGHDTVVVVGGEDDFSYNISKDGDYQIEWDEDNPTIPAPAKFQVKESPFANFNHNCR